MFSLLSGKHSHGPGQVEGEVQAGPSLTGAQAIPTGPSQLVALADALNSSPKVVAQRRLAEQLNAGARSAAVRQRAAGKEDDEERRAQATDSKSVQRWAENGTAATSRAGDGQGPSVQRQPNQTGLPDGLKAGIESLSGVSLDGVRVHRNSDKPAAVQAAAYTQGTDIHVAPGQEQHLAHEAWHVVQQQQGRVPVTRQVNGVAINDDPSLEAEATTMGAAALAQKTPAPPATATQAKALPTTPAQHKAQGPAQRQPSAVVQRFPDPEAAHEWIAKSSGLKLDRGDYTLLHYGDRVGNCHGYVFGKDLNTVIAIRSVDMLLLEYKTKRDNNFPITVFMKGDEVAHSAVFHDNNCQHKLGVEGPTIRCDATVMAKAAGYDKIYKLPHELAEFSKGASNQNLDHFPVKYAFDEYMSRQWYIDDLHLPEESSPPQELQELQELSRSTDTGSAQLSAAIMKIKARLGLNKLVVPN